MQNPLLSPTYLLRIVRDLRPAHRFDTAFEITSAWLSGLGIELVLWDVDGTLMDYHGTGIPQQFDERIRLLFRSETTRHMILSNCDERRFLELARIFSEVPVVRGYTTPNGTVFRSIVGGKDSMPAARLSEVLAEGRMIRKPSGELVRMAMGSTGVNDPSRVVMVGDQYLTDIASANLAGARGVKVNTYARDSFPLRFATAQRLEAIGYLCRHGFSATKPFGG
ncbi:MAG: HAD hydrolase-like protein [Gemmatimonadales bacterium]